MMQITQKVKIQLSAFLNLILIRGGDICNVNYLSFYFAVIKDNYSDIIYNPVTFKELTASK